MKLLVIMFFKYLYLFFRQRPVRAFFKSFVKYNSAYCGAFQIDDMTAQRRKHTLHLMLFSLGYRDISRKVFLARIFEIPFPSVFGKMIFDPGDNAASFTADHRRKCGIFKSLKMKPLCGGFYFFFRKLAYGIEKICL